MFESWSSLLKDAAEAAAFFVLIVVMSRVLGKRVTANMNSFDWIVTVTIGSMAAAGILSESVPALNAMAAIIMIGALQWLTTWGAVRSPRFSAIVKSKPRVLFVRGRYVEDALLAERITEAEVDAAIRNKGYAHLDSTNWVIVETNGDLSVIPENKTAISNLPLFDRVRHPKRE